jgi:hypothetical protein
MSATPSRSHASSSRSSGELDDLIQFVCVTQSRDELLELSTGRPGIVVNVEVIDEGLEAVGQDPGILGKDPSLIVGVNEEDVQGVGVAVATRRLREAVVPPPEERSRRMLFMLRFVVVVLFGRCSDRFSELRKVRVRALPTVV